MRATRVSSFLLAGVLGGATVASAQVVRLEITSREPINNGQAAGSAGPFEVIRGKVHGEIDPRDPHNTIIQDLDLAPRNARGKVEYAATFALAKPVDMSKAVRVLLYQVVNRGNGQVAASPEGYVSLVSGWQGDVIPTANNQSLVVPIARNRDGSAITGPVVARFYDVPDGALTAPIRLASLGTAQPYPPAGLEQPDARLTWHTRENYSGEQDAAQPVARRDWAFANCESTPWPGTPDPTRICLKDGFRTGRLYDLVYTAGDPLVLGVGLAATRDLVSFFRHAKMDSAGTPNPVAGAIDRAVSVGDSQSGNFIRTFIHLGFNRDLQNRMVWEGAFPRIAARQTPINLRFALPGGAAGIYEPGSEGVVWWTHSEDKTRKLPAAGLLDRCTATRTCPKIIEAFGSSEFWGLRMSPDLIGTDARHDLPLPDNVRRYYYPGTTHGGGRGGFRVDTTANNACVLSANPNPESDQTRALTRALVEWVTKGTPPPPSRYPRLANGDLVPPTRAAVGYPDVPGLPFSDRVLNPVVRYDFGPGFKAADLSGTMSIVPPRVIGVVPTYLPRVNEDGNETAGVPSVLLQAPLGTYLGWNVYRSGFFAGQGCGFQGGWIPFAKTAAERLANHDPRPSLEERYGTLEHYVAIVKRAADQAVRDRFLLPDDAERIVHEAETSNILPQAAAAAPAAPAASCEPLASMPLPNATVTAARADPAGEFTSGRTFQVPAFCRVMVTARPTTDSDVKVEVWVPDAWNGKLLGTDNGGFSGAISYAALAGAVTRGYAAVSTDTGHTGGQMDFGIGHPEKIVDWAYRSVHEMTTIAKTVVERAK
ncbi:MAG: alpha/beta hydrolase domain-containing protein [Acidobacteriota bacterium]